MKEPVGRGLHVAQMKRTDEVSFPFEETYMSGLASVDLHALLCLGTGSLGMRAARGCLQ